MTRTKFRTRLRIIGAIIFLILLVFVIRLYVVQVVYGDEFSERAERQYVSAITAPFNRGTIFFSRQEGEDIAAATINSGFTVALNPSTITDPEEVYAALTPLLTLDREEFFEAAQKEDDPYEEIAYQVPEEIEKKISEKDLDGVLLVREQWRYYPGNSLAAHTIGFIAEDEKGELAGRFGIERFYEETLSRESNALYVNFFAEVFANLGDLIFDRNSTREGHVVTTLELHVQAQLEQILQQTQERWGSKETAGIIMHPQTGAIYAMGSYPTFDLNDRSGVSLETFSNPLVENVYEFGSVIKPLTMTMGIDSGAVTPESTYNDTGSIKVDSATVSNYDGKARGVVDMQEVLNQSLNLGVAHVVSRMGTDTFRSYMKKLAIGEKTNIDLPDEAAGLVSNLESPRTLEYVTASFGQGIAFSPVAATRALASIANEGQVVQPHVADYIAHPSGLRTELEWKEPKRVFSKEASETVTRMLVTVVDEALSGGTVAVPTMSIAAKTGTAQISSPTGGYYDDRYLHSFFGFFPAYDPEFIIFLYTVEPQGVRYASETLTEPFMELVHFISNHYNIEPDRIYEESV